MSIHFDEYIGLDSPLHRWETKPKLVGLIVLIFAFAFARNWQLLPLMVGITLLLYGLSKLPIALLFSQLRYPSFFLLGIVGALPFVSGDTALWQWGGLSLRLEGLQAAILISGRFLCIATLALILVKTTPVLNSLAALRSLGLPAILADMMLLSYRYLFEIGASLTAMQQAMHLRGFRSRAKSQKMLRVDRGELQGLALLMGTLLVRSYEQSERVYQAMRLRGYGLQASVGPGATWRGGWGCPKSNLGAIAALLVASVFIATPWG